MSNPALATHYDPAEPIQSPYLPGTQTQFAFDSTSLGMFKSCARLYQYTMLEGWQPRGESIHLRFGQEYHTALEDYDRLKHVDKLTHEEAIHETVLRTYQRTADFNPEPDTKASKYKSRSNLLKLIVDYLDKYATDPAKTMILDNGQPAVELSFRFELDWGPKGSDQPYLLSGHLDRVVSFNDELFVLDHKTTTTTLGGYYFDNFQPDNQMTLYTLAAQVILEAPIKGVIVDAAQIMLEKPNAFVRGFTYRTKDQINEWVDDLQYWFSLAEQFSQNNYWPMNDRSCGMYGGCKYRGICSKSPQVRETFLKSEFDRLPLELRWNPISPRGPR